MHVPIRIIVLVIICFFLREGNYMIDNITSTLHAISSHLHSTHLEIFFIKCFQLNSRLMRRSELLTPNGLCIKLFPHLGTRASQIMVERRGKG
jgi:hypothetical protein